MVRVCQIRDIECTNRLCNVAPQGCILENEQIIDRLTRECDDEAAECIEALSTAVDDLTDQLVDLQTELERTRERGLQECEQIDRLTAVLSAAYAAFLAGHSGDLKDIFERYWKSNG
jgi:hypothetical protein